MKKILILLICSILLINITGCSDTKEELLEEQVEQEKFMIGNTLEDGKIIHFTFDIPYNNDYLSTALSNKEISLEDFINKLDYVDSLNDGGSKLYKYNEYKKTFGDTSFYAIVCNSLDNINDIYVAKYRENLNDKCSLKIDDLEGVSMSIKESTLSNTCATIVITDTSNRNNIYGEEYRIDKKENGIWNELDVVVEGNYAWNAIGYSVNKDNKLELDINWEWLYGKLKPGEYRIVKSTSYAGEGTKHYITAEFSIE